MESLDLVLIATLKIAGTAFIVIVMALVVKSLLNLKASDFDVEDTY